jgi:oxygen-dependent protoporphyrinogen oxidase
VIAVIGGGITGLCVGWELTQRRADCVVLEEGAEPGGVVRSTELDGRVLDWGPQRTRLTSGIARLIDALDLGDRVVTAPLDLDLYVYRGGRLRVVPFSVAGFLASDIVSWRAKARMLLEPLTAAADPDERVADFFRRKVGSELYDVLIAPLYGGLYASDPADMQVGLSLIHSLRELRVRRSLLAHLLRRGGGFHPPPACSFEGGMQELPLAIARALGERLRLDTSVRSLRRRGTGWCVECEDEVVEAQSVVVCTPAPAAGELLAKVAPERATAVASLRYNQLGIVQLDADTALRGLGFQVAFTERDVRLRGVTFHDRLFGRRNLYTAYLGGARHPEVAEMGEEELARLAEREFAACTGYDAEALAVGRARMPAWDMSWKAIEDLDLPPGLHVAGSWRSRPGLPGRLAEAARVGRALAPAMC